MGIVKYTGPVASFHCPTNAEIRSLKVHFSPKQEGTGDPSPENVREIVGWNGVEVYDWTSTNVSTSSVPNEYKKVEYLESTGTQYIATSYIPASGVYIDFKYLITKNYSNDEMFFGATESGVACYAEIYDKARWYAANGKSRYANVHGDPSRGAGTNNVYTAHMDSDKLIVDGYTATPRSQFSKSLTYPIYIFAWNSSGNAQYLHSALRLYELKFFENNVLSANFVPCVRKSDNKPGMYDTVSQTFYTNAGTGEFLYGSEVNGYTTNYEFGVLGKNKFNENSITFGKFVNKNREIDNATYWGMSSEIYVGGYTTLTIMYNEIAPGSIRLVELDSTKNIIKYSSKSWSGNNDTPLTIILQSNTSYLYVCISTGDSSVDMTAERVASYKLQLEAGDTATEYKPYNSNHTVYGGWVDLITGEVVATHGRSILTGSEQNWAWSASSNGIAYLTISDMKSGTWYTDDGALCDGAIKTNNATSGGLKCLIGYNNNKIYIYNSTTEIQGVTDLESFQTWLSTHNITITYPITTPNTYHLPPTALQTFLGQNNVWSNADYVEVEYDLHETQDILARKQFIMANQPHIVTPAAAPLQNFVTDVPAPLKECKVHFGPVQNLHGYSNPWPAGGGKNIAKPYDNSYVSSTYISFDYSAANGTFRCYGTASASSTHSSPSATNAVNNGATFTLPAGTYTLSIIDGDGTYIYAQCVSSDETVLAETTSYTTFTTNEALTVFVRLKVAAGGTVDNTVKIQLEVGSAATSYVPYENICPISGQSELMMKRAGKNLFDPWATGYYSPSAGTWMAGSQNTNCKPLRVRAGTVVTLSQINTGRDFSFEEWKNCPSSTSDCVAANLFTRASNATGATQTYTVQNDCWLTARVNIGVDATTETIANAHIQLELGSIATPYEPYSGTTLPIDWTTEAGTVYGGYVDLVTGEVWKTYHKIVADGTNVVANSSYMTDEIIAAGIVYLSPYGLSSSTLRNNVYYEGKASNVFTDIMPIYTTTYAGFGGGTISNTPQLPCAVATLAGAQYIVFRIAKRIDYPEVTDATTCKAFVNAWLQEHPVTIVYELKTPELVTSLTPTQLKTLRGTNNIWANNNGGNIDLSFWKH